MTQIYKILSITLVGLFCSNCMNHIQRPEHTIERYIEAVEAEHWRVAYQYLASSQRGSMTENEFITYCEEHNALMHAQAESIATAMESEDFQVHAQVQLGPARRVNYVLSDNRWYFQENIPLLEGGDTPEATLAALANTFESEVFRELLHVMSEDMQDLYTAEYDEISSAFAQAAESQIEIRGNNATVRVGDVTIRLLKEEGTWRFDGIEQTVSRDHDYYEDEW